MLCAYSNVIVNDLKLKSDYTTITLDYTELQAHYLHIDSMLKIFPAWLQTRRVSTINFHSNKVTTLKLCIENILLLQQNFITFVNKSKSDSAAA